MILAFNEFSTDLKSLLFKPWYHFMDKEIPITLNNMEFKYQLVPPGNHRAKNVERVIYTFNNHLIALLCSADLEFQLQIWDSILPQSTIILDLIRKSRLHPQLSAYKYLNG